MTKVISLSEKAYEVLSRLKRNKESFSDVVMRMAKESEPRPLTDFAGRWVGPDIDDVFERITKEREEARSREL